MFTQSMLRVALGGALALVALTPDTAQAQVRPGPVPRRRRRRTRRPADRLLRGRVTPPRHGGEPPRREPPPPNRGAGQDLTARATGASSGTSTGSSAPPWEKQPAR